MIEQVSGMIKRGELKVLVQRVSNWDGIRVYFLLPGGVGIADFLEGELKVDIASVGSHFGFSQQVGGETLVGLRDALIEICRELELEAPYSVPNYLMLVVADAEPDPKLEEKILGFGATMELVEPGAAYDWITSQPFITTTQFYPLPDEEGAELSVGIDRLFFFHRRVMVVCCRATWWKIVRTLVPGLIEENWIQDQRQVHVFPLAFERRPTTHPPNDLPQCLAWDTH